MLSEELNAIEHVPTSARPRGRRKRQPNPLTFRANPNVLGQLAALIAATGKPRSAIIKDAIAAEYRRAALAGA